MIQGVDVVVERTGRRFVVTGAASGIGRSVALLAAERGGALCLVDRDTRALDELADRLRGEGRSVATVPADLADPDAPAKVIAEAVSALGGIDALVSNAGVPVVAPLAELTVDAFDLSVAVNARSTWLLGREAHPYLKASGGAIVATASITATQPTPPLGAYAAAKAALLMLVKHMALEWGPDGIRCNSVSPGPTVTGMTQGIFNDMTDPQQRAMRAGREAHVPLRKLGDAEEVASAIMFLAGEEASQITGIDLLVDGGLSLSLMPAAGGGSGFMRP
jgi:NAD(P)-dependent dehydrogenase (short-subunit alcohol dehydrogenase family)